MELLRGGRAWRETDGEALNETPRRSRVPKDAARLKHGDDVSCFESKREGSGSGNRWPLVQGAWPYRRRCAPARVLFFYPEDGGGWRGDCFDLNFWIIDFNITRRMVEGIFVSFLLPICIFWVK
jgi:hypothetical protein